MALTINMHRNRSISRTFVMRPWLTVPPPHAPASFDLMLEKRRQCILDMTGALSAMFGDAALSIADSQPNASDVGGKSGIRWQDLADELRAAKLLHTITVPPAP